MIPIPITDAETIGDVSDSVKTMAKLTMGEVAEKYLVVKIHVDGPSMVACNQDLSIIGLLLRSPGQEEVYDQLRKQVVEKGQEVPVCPGMARCFKAFFYGLYKGRTEGDDGHKIEINPEQVLPMDKW